MTDDEVDAPGQQNSNQLGSRYNGERIELPADGRGMSLRDRLPQALVQARGSRMVHGSDAGSNHSMDSEEHDWKPADRHSETLSVIR